MRTVQGITKFESYIRDAAPEDLVPTVGAGAQHPENDKAAKRIPSPAPNPPAAAVKPIAPADAKPNAKSDDKPESPAPLSKLSVAGVADYLRSIGKPFEPYVSSFAANYINGAALCEATDADLIELGVTNRFHRLRILGDTKPFRPPAATSGGDEKQSVRAPIRSTKAATGTGTGGTSGTGSGSSEPKAAANTENGCSDDGDISF